MASKSLGGILFFAIDGQTYDAVGEPKYSVGKVSRETQVGLDRVHGYTERPHAPYIEVSLRDSATLSVAALNALNASSVQMQLRNGKLIVGAGMWTTDAQEVDSGEAKFTVRFEGVDGSVTEN